MFKGLQKPLEFMGFQGRYITWAACAVGGAILGFIITYIVFVLRSGQEQVHRGCLYYKLDDCSNLTNHHMVVLVILLSATKKKREEVLVHALSRTVYEPEEPLRSFMAPAHYETR